MHSFEGVKVFSVTKAKDRDLLGDRATEWLRQTDVYVTDVVVRQSSDREFHCLTLVFFYRSR